MARVTSKLQVTIPKRIADRYGIRPGGEIEWLEAGEAIRVLPAAERAQGTDTCERLELFDAATVRQRAREREGVGQAASADRGWSREELYTRGRAR